MYTLILQAKGNSNKGIRFHDGRLTGILFLISACLFFSFVERSTIKSEVPIILQDMSQPLLIEHEMFKLGGVLSAMNTVGKVTSEQNVISSPVEVDITTWDPGKYILVFKSNNYNSIVATIDIP